MCPLASSEYFCFVRRFRVERVPNSTRWCAVGRKAGAPAYVLDKLGEADTQDEMQGKLDAWARRQGVRPMAVKDAAKGQMRLAGV